MTQARRTEIFDVPIEKFYETVIDYCSYPKFVSGVTSIKIINSSESDAEVAYEMNLIKKFKYTLKMKHVRPTSVSWSFLSGDMFKVNSGEWALEKLDNNRTKVTYKIDVEFKGFMPKMVVDNLVSANLPLMMKAYYEQAKMR